MEDFEEDAYEGAFNDVLMFRKLQKYLGDVTQATIPKYVSKILSMMDLESNQEVEVLVKEVISIIRIRPSSVRLMAELITQLCEEYEASDISNTVIDCVFRNAFTNCTDLRELGAFTAPNLLLRALHLMTEVEISAIEMALTVFMGDYPNSVEQFFYIFCFYACELDRFNAQFVDAAITHAEKLNSNCRFPPLIDVLKDMIKWRQTGWKELKFALENYVQPGSIGHLIMTDNAEGLKKIAQANGMVHSSKMPFLMFHPTSIMQNYPTIAQFAAFYGASNCLSVLLGTSEDYQSERMQTEAVFDPATSPRAIRDSILDFGIAGGAIDPEQLKNLYKVNGENVTRTKIAFRRPIDYQDASLSGSVLITAAKHNNLESCYQFITTGTSPVERGENNTTPLHIAAGNGFLPMYQLFSQVIENMSEVSDFFGLTPLHYAARSDEATIVEFITRRPEIECDVRDNFGQTPFFTAAANGSARSVEILSRTGRVDINARNRAGLTPLHIASSLGFSYLVGLLINLDGIDLYASAEFGTTAIHMAAENNHVEVMKTFLSHDSVDVNVKDMVGRTPKDMTTNSEIIELINMRNEGKV